MKRLLIILLALAISLGGISCAPSPERVTTEEEAPPQTPMPPPTTAPATGIFFENLSQIALVEARDLGLPPGYWSVVEDKEVGKLFEGSSEQCSVPVLEDWAYQECIELIEYNTRIWVWYGRVIQIHYALFPTGEAATVSFQQSRSKCKAIVAENLGIGNESYRLRSVVHFRMGNIRVLVNVIDSKLGDPETYAKVVADKMVSPSP